MIGAVRGMASNMTWSSTVFLDTLAIWSFAAWPFLGRMDRVSWIWHCTYSFIRPCGLPSHCMISQGWWNTSSGSLWSGLQRASLLPLQGAHLPGYKNWETASLLEPSMRRVDSWIHNDSHACMILHDSHRFFFAGRHASPATSGHACHANVLWRSLFHYRPCEECKVHYQCGWSLHADPGRAYEPWFDKWMPVVCLIMPNEHGLIKRSWDSSLECLTKDRLLHHKRCPLLRH